MIVLIWHNVSGVMWSCELDRSDQDHPFGWGSITLLSWFMSLIGKKRRSGNITQNPSEPVVGDISRPRSNPTLQLCTKTGPTDLTSMFSDSPAVVAQQCSSWNKPRTQSFCGRQRSRSSFLSAQTSLGVPLPVCRYQNRKMQIARQTWTAGFSRSSLWSLLPKWAGKSVNTHTHKKAFSVRHIWNMHSDVI